jgi:ABC-type transport system substrate-binding protein/fibronectin type 3 domain-containing protein
MMRLLSIAVVGLLLFSFAGSVALNPGPVNVDKIHELDSSNDSPQDSRTVASLASHAASDTFVMVGDGEPETLDPACDYEWHGQGIIQNVYETLVWYDGDDANELVPTLATNVPTVENGGVTSDGLYYLFLLRQGVKFHDGTTMDAYDVEYSLERVLIINDFASPAWMLGELLIPDYMPGEPLDPYAVGTSVQVVNQYAIMITLVHPYTGFVHVLAETAASIVSMEYVEAHGGVVVNTRNDWMARHECGTGPFMLREWASNQYVMIERFQDYWRESAKLKYVVIKNVPDLATREMMLFSGDADTIEIPSQNRTDVIGRPGLRIVEGNPTFVLDPVVGFNQAIMPSDSIDIGNISSQFFADTDVRRAFVHAFDYVRFLTDAIDGAGVRPRGAIPNGMFGCNDSVPLQDYNLTQSAECLELAIDDRTGGSYAEQGFHLILYYNTGNLIRESVCQIFKENLESLSTSGKINGEIIVDVQSLDWPTYASAYVQSQLPIFFFSWGPDYVDPADYTKPFYEETSFWPYIASLQNHTLTLMCQEAAQEWNKTLRAETYYDIEMAVYDNAYYAWLAQATDFYVERDWVTGYYYHPMFIGPYYYSLNLTRPWPDAPRNVTMVGTIDRVSLEWDGPQWSGNTAITNYSIYRGIVPGGTKDYVGNTTGNETSYVDSSVAFGQSYYYCISAWNSYGEGAISDEASCPMFQNTPEDAIVGIPWMYEPILSQSVDEWHGSTNATWLVFYDTNGSFHGIPTEVGSYWLNVSGSNENGSAYLNYTIDARLDVVPAAPENLQATASVGHISLSWQEPPPNGGSSITNYKIYRGTSSGGENYIATIGNLLSYSDTAVTSGTTYYYRISAVNAAGEGSQSNEASATVPTMPSAPQNLNAISSAAKISLTWNAPLSNGGSAITKYKIYRGPSAAGESLLTTIGNQLSYADTSVAPGTTYYYKVSALNAVGEGPQSNEASAAVPAAAPSAPEDLQAVSGVGQVLLTWQVPSADGGSAIVNYSVYRGSESGGESLLIILGNQLTYQDSTVAPGTIYYFYITATNSVGEGQQSNEVIATTPDVPSAPLNLQAAPGDGQLNLTWSAPASDGGSTITGYKIYRGTSSGAGSYLAGVGTGTLTYIDTSLTNGQTYYYGISAVNAVGEGAKSDEINATPRQENTVPSSPKNLQVSPGNGQATLTWSAPASDGGSLITNYKVYRGTSSGGESYLAMIGNQLTFTDTDLTNGQTYYYKISAINALGEGPKSDEVSATPNQPITTPSSVQNLLASAGNGNVTLTWSVPADNGGSPITGYKIYRGTTSGAVAYLTTVTTTSYSDTDVMKGQTYYYKICAVNVVGEGSLSSEVSATLESAGNGGIDPTVLAGIAVVGVAVVAAVVFFMRKARK